jgi:hypothetical protein
MNRRSPRLGVVLVVLEEWVNLRPANNLDPDNVESIRSAGVRVSIRLRGPQPEPSRFHCRPEWPAGNRRSEAMLSGFVGRRFHDFSSPADGLGSQPPPPATRCILAPCLN